jgi:hypothetical protein
VIRAWRYRGAGRSTAAHDPRAIIGLGTWGQNLARSVQGQGPHIQFTAAATRTPDRRVTSRKRRDAVAGAMA